MMRVHIILAPNTDAAITAIVKKSVPFIVAFYHECGIGFSIRADRTICLYYCKKRTEPETEHVLRSTCLDLPDNKIELAEISDFVNFAKQVQYTTCLN